MNRELQADLIAQLAQLWKYGVRPDIFAFLADHDDASTDEKLQLMLFDQAQRWQQDEPISVEEYLEQVPDIADDDDSVLELAASEYEQRERNSRPQPFDEFVARFPRLESALRERLKSDTIALDGDTGQSATMTFVAANVESWIGRFRLQRVLDSLSR